MEQNILLRAQQDIRNRPNSRQRLSQLKKQQQNLSQIFKIDNFYNQEKLDIATLKKRIGQMKTKVDQVKQNPQQQPKTKKSSLLVPLTNRIQKLYLPKKSNQKPILTGRQTASSSRNKKNSSVLSGIYLKNRNTINISHQLEQHKNGNQSKRKTGINFQSNHLQKTEVINSRYQSIDQQTDKKVNQFNQEELYGNFRSTMIPKIQNIGRRQNLTNYNSQKSQSLRKILNSSRLQPLSSCKKKLNQIKVQNEQQLMQFERNIKTIWSLYEKLSQITKYLSYQSQSIFSGKIVSQQFVKVLCEYKQLVCSTKLQFMIQIIDECLQFSHAKTIILSRLFENLSVVYVFLQIVQQATANRGKINSSHLVNFVGISSNNLLLTLRLITIISIIDQSLTISQDVISIFNAISQFQLNSYRCQITSIKQTIVRMEHNNSLITIIQNKLNNKMATKQYHKSCFGKFIKGIIIDRLKQQIQIAGDKGQKISQTKPFFQYSYFIFQYLAFHLHHEEYLGLFPKEIQTAPQPYLPLKKQFTIILDPAKILVYSGKQKVYIRAFAEKFLFQLSQKCNIVFWGDKMPNYIDSIYDLVDIKKLSPSRQNQDRIDSTSKNNISAQIKRLYKHHCYYDYNCKGQVSLIKDMSRAGCIPGKYIILDSNLQNYLPGEQDKTILLPWKGQAKDSKLSLVLDLLLPFFRQGTDLNKGMALLKPRLEELLKAKRRNLVPAGN